MGYTVSGWCIKMDMAPQEVQLQMWGKDRARCGVFCKQKFGGCSHATGSDRLRERPREVQVDGGYWEGWRDPEYG